MTPEGLMTAEGEMSSEGQITACGLGPVAALVICSSFPFRCLLSGHVEIPLCLCGVPLALVNITDPAKI